MGDAATAASPGAGRAPGDAVEGQLDALGIK
jgi:hypothetical protein